MSDLLVMVRLPYIVLVLIVTACASPHAITDYPDSVDRSRHLLDEDRYKQAEQFLSWNMNRLIIDAPSGPVWSTGDRFWYRVDHPDGHRFWSVDPEKGEREPAFDHARMSRAIARRGDISLEDGRIPFRHFRYLDGRSVIEFRFRGQVWRCDLSDYSCEEPSDPPESISFSVDSPDGRYAAYTEEFDLWVYDRELNKEIRLTDDGEIDYGYATDSQGWTRSDRPILKWSPDSRRIATFRQDDREVGRMRLVEMREGRPGLDEWPYALPGDSTVPMLERVVIDVKERSVIRLDVEASHQRSSNCCGLIRDGAWADVEWSPDGTSLAFVSTSRDYSEAALYVADPVSGETRYVYSETDEPFFESNLTSRGIPNWRILHDSDEFLWYTRSSGWGHLYLHDLQTGERTHAITSGDWNVLDLYKVDTENRQIYFTGVGREEGVDPYFTQFYRADMDNRNLERLTVRDDHHTVSLSPSGDFFVVNRSRPDQAPVTELNRSDGGVVMELGRHNLDLLEKRGFRMPTPFTVKARDGETDLYGLLAKPSDFDPEKSYPLVVSIYPGPQIGSVGSRSFSTSRRGQAHALAELGFVVMLLDGFGTPFRSKEFHTWWYGDMADNGLEDQVEAIWQLSERYEWIDRDRVGIYGHSGGGYATVAAMLRFPDQFHVGVAGAGNHDNRSYTYYWGEKYQGPLEDESGEDRYRRQTIHQKADRLEGRLLISYGSLDDNVHPNMTLLLVDRLITANKDFDLMVFPNRGHGYASEPYKIRLTWDYFVRHLLGKEPPKEYSFGR